MFHSWVRVSDYVVYVRACDAVVLGRSWEVMVHYLREQTWGYNRSKVIMDLINVL